MRGERFDTKTELAKSGNRNGVYGQQHEGKSCEKGDTNDFDRFVSMTMVRFGLIWQGLV